MGLKETTLERLKSCGPFIIFFSVFITNKANDVRMSTVYLSMEKKRIISIIEKSGYILDMYIEKETVI